MIVETQETPTGAVYTLRKVPYGYQWSTTGTPAKTLSGLFVELNDAKRAFGQYLSVLSDDKQRLKYEPTPEEELDVLTKKHELVAFASKYGIEIPPALSRPTQIKKMLKDAL